MINIIIKIAIAVIPRLIGYICKTPVSASGIAYFNILSPSEPLVISISFFRITVSLFVCKHTMIF